MKHLRRAVVTFSVATAALLLFALIGSASAAPSRAGQVARPSSAFTAHHIVRQYTPPRPLLSATRRTMQGDKIPGGGLRVASAGTDAWSESAGDRS